MSGLLEKIALSPDILKRARIEARKRQDALNRSQWGRHEQTFTPKEMGKTRAMLRRAAQEEVFAGTLPPGKALRETAYYDAKTNKFVDKKGVYTKRYGAREARAAEEAIGIKEKPRPSIKMPPPPKQKQVFKGKPKTPPGRSATAKELAKKLLTKRNLLAAGLTAGGVYLGTKGHEAMFGKEKAAQTNTFIEKLGNVQEVQKYVAAGMNLPDAVAKAYPFWPAEKQAALVKQLSTEKTASIEDYNGRILARAFHDELEKVAAPSPFRFNPDTLIGRKLRGMADAATRAGATSARRALWVPKAVAQLRAQVAGTPIQAAAGLRGLREGALGRALQRIKR